MDRTPSQLYAEIEARVRALGYDLWDVRTGGTRRRAVLEVRIDRLDSAPGEGITVDECARVSRSLESWLDEGKVLGPSYRLVVSSPGMERPLRQRRHWARYVGSKVRVRLPGRGMVTAHLMEVCEAPEELVLRIEGEVEPLRVPLADARDATLVVDWSAIEGLLSNRRHG